MRCEQSDSIGAIYFGKLHDGWHVMFYDLELTGQSLELEMIGPFIDLATSMQACLLYLRLELGDRSLLTDANMRPHALRAVKNIARAANGSK